MDAERIPKDIIAAARSIVGSGSQITLPYDAGDAHVGFSSRRNLCERIARALLAERERCAKIASSLVTSTEKAIAANPDDAIGRLIGEAINQGGRLVVNAIRTPSPATSE